MSERRGRAEDKVAIVTGAGSTPGPGMATGRACAIVLAREGARVLLADINPERAEETRAIIEGEGEGEGEGGKAAVFAGDMTRAADCDAMVRAAVDAFGTLDILVNNIGVAMADEQIDDAVTYADPMALRGLLYQLTGDESIAATKVGSVPGYVGGNLSIGLTDPADVVLLRAKAAQFLKSFRDSGAGPVGPGPPGRLPRSLALAGGLAQLPEDDDVELWIEELALDPWARGLSWEQPPDPGRVEGFSVIVVGAGMGGLNAAAHLKHPESASRVIEKNSGVGGTWFENRYPGARVDSPSRAYTHILGVELDCPSPWCTREENQRYFNWLADRYGIREHIVFDTEVATMTWHEETATWEVLANGPDGPLLALQRPARRAREVQDLQGPAGEQLLPQRARSLRDELPVPGNEMWHRLRRPDFGDLIVT